MDICYDIYVKANRNCEMYVGKYSELTTFTEYPILKNSATMLVKKSFIVFVNFSLKFLFFFTLPLGIRKDNVQDEKNINFIRQTKLYGKLLQDFKFVFFFETTTMQKNYFL